MQENLLAVDIFLQSMQYQETIETQAISTWDMFSNIGGTLGLYLGASLLTVMEILEFSWRMIMSCCHSKKVCGKKALDNMV